MSHLIQMMFGGAELNLHATMWDWYLNKILWHILCGLLYIPLLVAWPIDLKVSALSCTSLYLSTKS